MCEILKFMMGRNTEINDEQQASQTDDLKTLQFNLFFFHLLGSFQMKLVWVK